MAVLPCRGALRPDPLRPARLGQVVLQQRRPARSEHPLVHNRSYCMNAVAKTFSTEGDYKIRDITLADWGRK